MSDASLIRRFPVRRTALALLLQLLTIPYLLASPGPAAGPPAVEAAGRGWPAIHLSDAAPAFREVRSAPELEPLSLAAADFDGDGLADLAVGYRTVSGGLVRVLRADPDFVFDHSPSARARRREGRPAERPFAEELARIELAAAPDLLAAGDLDGDRRADLVAGELGGSKAWLAVQRGGRFEVSSLDLRGRLTALVGGELDLRDGLLDVAAAVETPSGREADALVLLSGRVGAPPRVERLALDGPATALALGELDLDGGWDLVVGTLAGIEVVHGRVSGAGVGRRTRTVSTVPGGVAAVVVGDLLDGGAPGEPARDEIAYLDAAGVPAILGFEGTAPSAATRPRELPGVTGSGRLVVGRLDGSTPRSQLLVADVGKPGLLVLRPESERAGGRSVEPLRLDAVAEAVAVLPMRLDKHPLDGLVILLEGVAEPLVVRSGPVAVHVVDSGGVEGDCDVNDGVCSTSNGMTCSGPCTLRAAIQQANWTGGLHEIDFAFAGPGPHEVDSFGQLAITSLTVDGTSAPGYVGQPVIWHVSATTFDLNAGSFTVRGMGLGATAGPNVAGVAFGASTSASHVEACWIGQLGAHPGPAWGVYLFGGASGLHLGGPAAGQGNVIWGATSTEVDLRGSGHEIAGNRIGLDPAGAPQLGDASHGPSVSFSGVSNSQFGLGGVGNHVAGTAAPGQPAVLVADASGVALRSNTIGLDLAGAATGNLSHGLRIVNQTPSLVVGGAVPGDGNVISGNALSGVSADFGPGLVELYGNLVGVAADGVTPRGNGEHGIVLKSGEGGSRIGGAAVGQANVFAWNGGDGVRIESGWHNAVRRNAIYSNGGLGIELCSGSSCTGPDVNDPLDADGGDWIGHANRHQNHPVVGTIEEATVGGALDSAAAETFDLDFFASPSCDGSGHGEGRTFLGSLQVTTDGAGSATFTAPLERGIPAGWVVTATATGTATFDTSELSACSGPMLAGVIFFDGFESGDTSAW